MTNAKDVLEWIERKEERERNMTNEEWLRGATTEELAELIVNMTLLDKYKLYDRFEFSEYEHGIGVGAKQEAMLWLKEKHNE